MERIAAHGLRLKVSKCDLVKKSVELLGHIVNFSGVSPDPENISSIQRFDTRRMPSVFEVSFGLRRITAVLSMDSRRLSLRCTHLRPSRSPSCGKSNRKSLSTASIHPLILPRCWLSRLRQAVCCGDVRFLNRCRGRSRTSPRPAPQPSDDLLKGSCRHLETP